MKEKETLKKRIVRLFYTIKGWNTERKMKVGEYYSSKHIPNSRLMYRGNHTFYQAFMAVVSPIGAVFEDQRKRTFKYWEIGILDFKKN